MMRRFAILTLALWGLSGLGAMAEEGPPGQPPKPQVIKADGLRGEAGETQKVTPLDPTTVRLHVKGAVLQLKARATSLDEEYIVNPEAPELAELAKRFGAHLTFENRTLVCELRGEKRSLKSGQVRISSTKPQSGPERPDLVFPIQELDGEDWVSLEALEALLDVRLTFWDEVKRDKARALGGERDVWVEPVIRAVRLDGTGKKPKLVVECTEAVTYKTFTLKNPDRYVIDVYGAVLDTPSLTLNHPELGNIRLGQFELGPARSRIVIPTQVGVAVQAPKTGKGETLAFQLVLPQLQGPAQHFQTERITAVNLEAMTGGQRLLLKASGPFQYEWQRLPDNRFLLDISQAVLAGPKEEMRVDGEYVSEIRVSQFQTDPSPVVRLVVGMNKPAEVRLRQGEQDGELELEILDKPVDPRMAVTRGYGTTAYPQGGGVICIDPGHGGSDPGAINRSLNLNEATVTLDICKRLAAILKKGGWNVVMTRTTDKDVSYWGSSAKEELGARVKIANDMKADLFLSVHCNASASQSSNGTSLHYYKRSDYTLAGELHPNVLSSTGRLNRGIVANRFYVLAHSDMPAVLVETAFLTNPTEGALLADPNYRQKIAEGIAAGLRQYASKNLNWAAAGR